MASTFQQYVQPAQQFFGCQKQPHHRTQYEPIDTSHSSPFTPSSTTMYSPYSQSLPMENKVSTVDRRAVRHLGRLRRITATIFSVADMCSCLLSLIMLGIMAYVLVVYYRTRNIPTLGRTGPWAENTKLWPTYTLAGGACVTFIVANAALVTSCRRSSKSTKLTDRADLVVRLVRIVVGVAFWVSIAVYYRLARTGNDLWGWSCGPNAGPVQQDYDGVLDFEHLCNVQTSSWIIAMIEAGSKIFFAAVGLRFWHRTSRLRKAIAGDLGDAGWTVFENGS